MLVNTTSLFSEATFDDTGNPFSSVAMTHPACVGSQGAVERTMAEIGPLLAASQQIFCLTTVSLPINR